MKYFLQSARMAVLLILLTQSIFFIYALETYKDNQVPMKVVDCFYKELPSDLPVVLDIETGRFTQEVVTLLKQRLFEDGYNLFEKPPNEYQLIKLSYFPTTQLTTHKRLFGVTEIRHTAHNFSYQITSYPGGKVDVFDKVTLLSQPIKQNTRMRWYDPIFISAIVGGLAYLLYFGN